MNPFPGHFERSGRSFRTRVGCADRERSLRERTGRGAAMPRDDRQGAKNFFERHLHADHSWGTNKKLLRRATQPLRGFGNRSQSGSMARFAGGAIGIAGVYHHGAHAAFGRAQVLFGNKHGCGNNEVLREDRGSRSRNIARKNREIERAGFLQAAGGGGEAEPARQGGFGECVLHQRKIRRTSAPAPEGTSDPPQPQRGRIVVSLPGLHSWLGSCFAGFFVETCFQIGDRGTHVFWRRAASKLRLCAKSAAKAGEIFLRASRGSAVHEIFCFSASRSTLPTMS